MSILVNGSKKNIIDRTLIHMKKNTKTLNGHKVADFLKLLYGLGVDLIEIDNDIVSSIVELPQDLNYVYRINKNSDVLPLNNQEYDYVVIEYKNVFDLDVMGIKRIKNNKVMLEIGIEDLDELYLDENSSMFISFNIKCIMIKNINKYNLKNYAGLIKNLKTNFLVEVGFCTCNKFYMGTAITMEVCTDGADFITTAFNGENYGYTPLEEIIVALKIIKNSTLSGNLKLLPQIVSTYIELTGEKVYCMKAIIGEDIFKYESGIHVDGIAKDSKTYEPYQPSDIGKERKMLIGKHSGKKAIMVKLQELNIDYTYINMDDFLSEIREKSIRLRRNILDGELVEMCKNFNNV